MFNGRNNKVKTGVVLMSSVFFSIILSIVLSGFLKRLFCFIFIYLLNFKKKFFLQTFIVIS